MVTQVEEKGRDIDNIYGVVVRGADGAHFAIRPRGPAAQPSLFDANDTLL
jgi:hypothetical protein